MDLRFNKKKHFLINSPHTTSSAETVRACLDVIAICSVVPKVMLLLCERVDMPDLSMSMSINLLLAASECEIIADADVQRAALRAIINCVCAPINRVGGNVARYSLTGSAKKKTNIHNSEELIMKVWESVRSNNGIMVSHLFRFTIKMYSSCFKKLNNFINCFLIFSDIITTNDGKDTNYGCR